MKKVQNCIKQNENTIIDMLVLLVHVIIVILTTITFVLFLTKPAQAATYNEPPTWETSLSPSWVHTQAEMFEVLQEISTILNYFRTAQEEATYANLSLQLATLYVLSFLTGIQIITIFVLLWGRIK